MGEKTCFRCGVKKKRMRTIIHNFIPRDFCGKCIDNILWDHVEILTLPVRTAKIEYPPRRVKINDRS